ncbi:MAG: hypothetical protein QGG25_05625 [Phycisphaerae bacterium]|nr:hypothetical protein [Phycisphaerae bacterium]
MTRPVLYVSLAIALLVSPVGAANKKSPVTVNAKALRMAVEDLTRTFPKRYPKSYLARLNSKEKIADLQAFQRQALLANPLLDGMKILAVRRNYGKGARREIRTVTPGINAYSLAVTVQAKPPTFR